MDSGDRVALSIEARKALDDAGFNEAKIVCSGDLDELAIAEMKQCGAKIDIWGVGTKLSTGWPDGALNGVYKLSAVRRPGEAWRYRIKISDDPGKVSCPGLPQVRRFRDANRGFLADVIYEIDHPLSEPAVIVDFAGKLVREIPPETESVDLLVPIFRSGELVHRLIDTRESRQRTREQLGCLPADVTQLTKARPYHVGLETSLHQLRLKLIDQAQQKGT